MNTPLSSPHSQSEGRTGPIRWLFALWMVLALTGAQTAAANAPDLVAQPPTLSSPRGPIELLPVPAPDLSDTEAEVQEAIRTHRAALARLLAQPGPDLHELAEAYGKLGAFYQAHNIYGPAQPSYLNAERLAPDNFRWPYLLGYLGQQTAQLDLAEKAFLRALKLRPDDGPARLRLAQVYVQMDRLDEAARLLERPFSDPAMAAAVAFEKGKIALSERHYEDAVRYLEAALKAQPLANRIHYPLAMAYRALGQVDRAKGHFAEFGNGKPSIPDPVVEALDTLMRGGYTQLHRGVVSVQKGEYDQAVEAFAAALKADPDNVNIRVSLARTLYLAGRREAADREFAEALRRDPDHVLANFLSGVLLQAQGREEAALAHYRRVLKQVPDHSGAHHFLAHLLMKQGHYAQAAKHYAASLRKSPRDYPALFMEAMALYRAGAPQTRVKALLEQGVSEHPDKWMFSYALARLLAASPDDQVRDGERALELARKLYDQNPGFQNAEALALAFAEVGDYKKAVELENYAIVSAVMAGAMDQVPEMQALLARFNAGRPGRQPFHKDEPFFRPPPFDPTTPIRDYPTGDFY